VAEITVSVAPDGLKASLLVPGAMAYDYPSEQDLLGVLQSYKIVHGIDYEAVAGMVASRTCSRHVEVARGTPPQAGAPGRIEILVDISGKGRPKELEHGKVDHRDLRLIINLEKSTPLARRHPPVPGTPGMTVRGQPVPAPQSGDIRLPAGRGTEIDPNDPDLLVAAIAGGLSIVPGGLIEVRDQKTIRHDIDYATGNVSFTGDLYITGTVRAGFTVEATGSILIGGNVEDAVLRAGGDLEIAGAVVGSGKGSLEAAGTVHVRLVENFSIKSGKDILVDEDVLHSTFVAEGSIKARSFIGGLICALNGIEAEAIGSTAECRTTVDIGMRYARTQQRYELLRKLAHMTGEMASCRQQMFIIVRDGMNEHGVIQGEVLENLAQMKKRKVEFKKITEKLQADIERIESMETAKVTPFITAQTVYPNTVVKLGKNDRMIMELTHGFKIAPADSFGQE
jgi:uncharacterized protein